MGLGEHKCNRHPRHMQRDCPHHDGRPQEVLCECPPCAGCGMALPKFGLQRCARGGDCAGAGQRS